jgi:SAM-dependent methyltransferase
VSLPPLSPHAWLHYDVVRRLLPDPPGRLLEVGCGQGSMGARLAQRADYLGVEPDVSSASAAEARLAAVGRGEVRVGDLAVLGDEERFDTVCAFEVLEHLEDDAGALQSWVERLVPGGTLLLSTPAFASRFGPMDELVGHYRRYEPDALAAALTGAGLVDVRVVVYGAPLGFALERARNAIGRRRLRAAAQTSMTERTHGSGRLLQPDRAGVGLLTQAATLPFRRMQRVWPHAGTGLVARGRRPAAGGQREIS